MMEAFSNAVTAIDNWIWGLPMIVLLLGTHLFMTVRTGFIQRKTFTGIRLSVTKDPDSPGDVSQFQALTTALASNSLRRRRHGDFPRRPGRGALVLADWCVRHCDQVCGKSDRGQVPRADGGRPHAGRRDVCA